MKKMIRMAYAATLLFAACNSADKKAAEAETTEQKPAKVSKHSAEFNTSFETVLGAYYDLKDGLVATDSVKADLAATSLGTAIDSLKLTNLKDDSTGAIAATATDYLKTIGTEAKGLGKLANVEARRKQFQVISDAMYDLIRTVQYDNSVVYHQFCPMAFNDQGGYWLSKSSDIKNPYFGKRMLSCGEVKDSLNF